MFKVGVEMLMSPGSWGWLGLDNSTGQADLMIIFHYVIGKKFFILVHRTFLLSLTTHILTIIIKESSIFRGHFNRFSHF